MECDKRSGPHTFMCRQVEVAEGDDVKRRGDVQRSVRYKRALGHKGRVG
jgi:hypothetical protein